MNRTQQKIARMSKAIALVMTIGCILTAIAVILCAAGLGILSFSGSALSTSLQQAFQVDAAGGGIAVLPIATLFVLFLFAIAQLILLFFLLWALRRTFTGISRDYSPFEKKQVKRLKTVAVLTLAMAVASSISDGVGHKIVYGSASFSLHVMWFVLAIVIYCLSYIFDYGCRLQRQSDETL